MEPIDIYWLFNGRCVTCRRPAGEVSHIVPKGRGVKYRDDWKNQVMQCSECHRAHHQDGVTDEKIKKLYNERKSFLISIGRERFV